MAPTLAHTLASSASAAVPSAATARDTATRGKQTRGLRLHGQLLQLQVLQESPAIIAAANMGQRYCPRGAKSCSSSARPSTCCRAIAGEAS